MGDLSSIEKEIKRKIESIGIPLKAWDININYGIKTGLNEAFIIDGTKRRELIELDPKSDEIIRPLLRGRDIKRYSYEFADLYLLFIPWHFPLHNDPNIKGASLDAEKAFENQYPAIFNHLLQYKKELSSRNKVETGIRYEWYALQRWGANYWEDFYKQKIVWKIIGSNINFLIDSEGFFYNNAANILTSKSESLEVLIAFLNSKLFEWFFKKIMFIEVEGGGIQMFNTIMEKIPLPQVDEKLKCRFIELIEKRIRENSPDKIFILDQLINNLVYNIIDINQEEIEFIESQ
ncbi:TaqI-like C-terminal specificity domain-containing protein [Chryseobacterium sp. Marseille-Q8038]